MKKVKASWIISLPQAAILKVKKGDRVTCGQILFEASIETERVVALQNELKGLTADDIRAINTKNNQKEILQNEIIFESKGWFSRKITCPISGKFAGIDELLNLHLITGLEKRRGISPTEAIIGDIAEDELKLEFPAREYLGVGLSNSKGWVSNGFKKITSLSDINFDCKDRIILVEKMIDTIRLKSEVVGVGAIILLNENMGIEDARINFKIPSLAVTKEVFDDLLGLVEQVNVRALVNGNSGRLLLVV